MQRLVVPFFTCFLLAGPAEGNSPPGFQTGQPVQEGASHESLDEESDDVARSIAELIPGALAENDTEVARGLLRESVEALVEPRSDEEQGHIAFLVELDEYAERLGSVVEQRRLRELVLAIRTRLLPPDHPDLLRSKQKLAMAMSELGDLDPARSLFEDVLAAYERMLPPDHPSLQAVRTNLANVLYALGDLPEARKLTEQVLKTYSRILPDDHPDLLLARSNLANMLKVAGDFDQARLLEERVLAVRANSLAPEDPDLLRAKQNLAATKYSLGDLEGARALQEVVLESRARLLPRDHPDLIVAKLDLAVTKKELGNLEDARALEDEVLEAWTRLLPSDHPGLLRVKLSLAVTKKKLGDLEGARALEEEVCEARSRLLPGAHPDLLAAKVIFALTTERLGDIATASLLLEEVLTVRERSLGEDHPKVQESRRQLASLALRCTEFDKAVELFEAVVQSLALLLPPDHHELQEARRDLAAALRINRELDKAREVEAEIGTASAYPPTLRLLAPRGPHATIAERTFVLEALASDRSAIATVRVLQDGLELQVASQEGSFEVDESGRAGRLQLLVKIPKESFETTLLLQAINARGLVSDIERLIVRYQPPLRELYVLAAGVGDYVYDEIDLRFPANDVRELVAFFQSQVGSFYLDVHVRQLIDDEVTAERITRLKHKFLIRARPEDTVVVFVAGHGVRTETDEYFFLTPHATPAEPYAGLERSQVESLVTWDRLRARRRVLLLDTCHAGVAVEPGARGTERGLGVYGRKEVDAVAASNRRGVYVLAASTDYGFAKEQEGNGLFTRTLLDGLLGAAEADDDGLIEVEELRTYTEREVERRSVGRQVPTMPTVLGGENFALARVARDAK